MLHTSSAHNMQQHLKIIKKVYLCLIMETDITEILKKIEYNEIMNFVQLN